MQSPIPEWKVLMVVFMGIRYLNLYKGPVQNHPRQGFRKHDLSIFKALQPLFDNGTHSRVGVGTTTETMLSMTDHKKRRPKSV